MDLQHQAANELAEAFGRRQLNTTIARGKDPSVAITEHPEAVVRFKRGDLGGLLTEFVFDGRPPEYLDFTLPTPANAEALAEQILAKIADNEGTTTT